MGTFIDLTGDKYNRLTVVKHLGKVGKEHNWECVCECGNTTAAYTSKLRHGGKKSCGCLNDEMRARRFSEAKFEVHGGHKERLYQIWRAMKARCNNPNNKKYHFYGFRNIKVCSEWESSYAAFREWAIGNGYDPDAPKWQCTIDRIDSDGNYEPSNCRWVDMTTQRENQRRKGGINYATSPISGSI